jgi:hypothetical protein
VSEWREVRSYAYVNQPYAMVSGALQGNAAGIFGAATASASKRANAVAASLTVTVAGVQLGAEVALAVRSVEERTTGPLAPVTVLRIEWEAASSPGMFPVMEAELRVYPLTTEETQLDFDGRYEVPLGALGKAVDALVGHRIAEASVHRFLEDVGEHLRKSLASE